MIFMSACNSGTTEETGGETNKDPIKIGVLASQTGALESYGEQTVRGFELGFRLCNGWYKRSGRP